MQRLGAGSQFEERPMKDINRSGPSEERLSRVQALMTQLEKSGRTSAARTMLNAKRAELASTPKMDKEIEESRESDEEANRKGKVNKLVDRLEDKAFKAVKKKVKKKEVSKNDFPRTVAELWKEAIRKEI